MSFWYQKEIAVEQRCNSSFSTHTFGPEAIDSSCVQDLQNLYLHLFKLKTEGSSTLKSTKLSMQDVEKDWKRPPVHFEIQKCLDIFA